MCLVQAFREGGLFMHHIFDARPSLRAAILAQDICEAMNLIACGAVCVLAMAGVIRASFRAAK